MQDREGKKQVNLQGTIVSIMFGGVLALGGCCLLLLILSIAVATGIVPERSMDILCSVFCGICSLIGARFAVKSAEAPPLLLGMMTGVFMSLLIFLIGVGAFQQTAIEGNGLRILLATLIGGTIAGISRPNKKNKRKKSRKK